LDWNVIPPKATVINDWALPAYWMDNTWCIQFKDQKKKKNLMTI
jgi:hypothetical protein